MNAGGNISSGSGPIELRSGGGAPSGNLTAGGDFLPEAAFFPVALRLAITVGGNSARQAWLPARSASAAR